MTSVTDDTWYTCVHLCTPVCVCVWCAGADVNVSNVNGDTCLHLMTPVYTCVHLCVCVVQVLMWMSLTWTVTLVYTWSCDWSPPVTRANTSLLICSTPLRFLWYVCLCVSVFSRCVSTMHVRFVVRQIVSSRSTITLVAAAWRCKVSLKHITLWCHVT